MQLACATCMHAMLPPTLNAVLRTPRPLHRAVPLHAYDTLVAAAHAALQSLLPAGSPPPRILKVMRLRNAPPQASEHTTATSSSAAHPQPVAAPSSMHVPRSAPLDTSQELLAHPLAVVATGALYVMHLPLVDTEAAQRSSRSDPMRDTPRLLAELPISCVMNACRVGSRVEIGFVWPHAYDRERRVALSPAFHGEPLSPVSYTHLTLPTTPYV